MILRSSHWRRSAKIFEYVFFKIANLQNIQLHLCSRSMKNTCEGAQLKYSCTLEACNFNEKLNSVAGSFWLVLAQLQNGFFVEHLPVAAYVRCLKEKNEKNEIVCFYCTQSDILHCGIARFSRGNKNKLRIFQSQKWKKIKNSQPQTKFTGSYKKRVYTKWPFNYARKPRGTKGEDETFEHVIAVVRCS